MPGLNHHLDQEHKLSPSAQYISEIVYWGIDGIVTTFAVVAGFAGAGSESAVAQLWSLSVVLFGLANLFGDGVSMALGKYLSTRSEQDVYQRSREKEAFEIEHNEQMEFEESLEIVESQWMKHEDASKYIGILKQYPELRTKRMMDNELEMSDVRQDPALLQWVITLTSFVVFGFIPLIPYVFMNEVSWHWELSLVMTFVAMFLLGTVRRRITRMSFWKTVGQIILLGGVAAAVAYYTGDLVMKWLG